MGDGVYSVDETCVLRYLCLWSYRDEDRARMEIEDRVEPTIGIWVTEEGD